MRVRHVDEVRLRSIPLPARLEDLLEQVDNQFTAQRRRRTTGALKAVAVLEHTTARFGQEAEAGGQAQVVWLQIRSCRQVVRNTSLTAGRRLESLSRAARAGAVAGMSAPPASSRDPAGPYEVIHLGGEAAAIVPLPELRRPRALERRASAQDLDAAEAEAAAASFEA